MCRKCWKKQVSEYNEIKTCPSHCTEMCNHLYVILSSLKKKNNKLTTYRISLKYKDRREESFFPLNTSQFGGFGFLFCFVLFTAVC